jgi:hypothetical protein
MRPIVFMLALLTGADEPKIDLHQYLNETRHLVRVAKYDEALKRCLWFHEHAVEQDPAMVGVRGSFALAVWNDLAKKYSPARTALVETRDRSIEKLLTGKGESIDFLDVRAINDLLNESAKTTELFEQLDQKQPKLAKSMVNVAKNDLFAAKRFDLLKKYLYPIDEAFKEVHKQYDDLYQAGSKDWQQGASIRALAKDEFERDCLQLIKLAIESNDLPGAIEVQKNALRVLDRESIRKAVSPRNP